MIPAQNIYNKTGYIIILCRDPHINIKNVHGVNPESDLSTVDTDYGGKASHSHLLIFWFYVWHHKPSFPLFLIFPCRAMCSKSCCHLIFFLNWLIELAKWIQIYDDTHIHTCATRNTYINKHKLMSIEIKTSKYIHEKGGDCAEQWFYEMATLWQDKGQFWYN